MGSTLWLPSVLSRAVFDVVLRPQSLGFCQRHFRVELMTGSIDSLSKDPQFASSHPSGIDQKTGAPRATSFEVAGQQGRFFQNKDKSYPKLHYSVRRLSLAGPDSSVSNAPGPTGEFLRINMVHI